MGTHLIALLKRILSESTLRNSCKSTPALNEPARVGPLLKRSKYSLKLHQKASLQWSAVLFKQGILTALTKLSAQRERFTTPVKNLGTKSVVVAGRYEVGESGSLSLRSAQSTSQVSGQPRLCSSKTLSSLKTQREPCQM